MIPSWFTGPNQKWIEFLLKLAAGAGAVVAYVVGLKQYRKSQSWQKATFLATIINEFENNSKILAVKCMLDWDDGKIELEPAVWFDFENETFCSALRAPTSGEEVAFSAAEDGIRNALDVFFDFFEKVESYVSIGLLKFNDLKYFYYWFEALRSMDKWKNVECKAGLDHFLHAYHFFGVERLLAEYVKKVPIPPPGFPKERRSKSPIETKGAASGMRH
jgi:hypothetical protein